MSNTVSNESAKNLSCHLNTGEANQNVLFYKGLIPAQPDGVKVDEIHNTWFDDFNRLEYAHGYIQWLFPIPERGQNPQAQELLPHEAEEIRNDPEATGRFLKSYEMMLHFYGMKLVNPKSGEVDRANNWKKHLRNLNNSNHNFLRITRILKSLGELGLEHYKAPLLRFLLREAIEHRTLKNALDSCYDYWIPTVKDDQERESLIEHAKHLEKVRGCTKFKRLTEPAINTKDKRIKAEPIESNNSVDSGKESSTESVIKMEDEVIQSPNVLAVTYSSAEPKEPNNSVDSGKEISTESVIKMEDEVVQSQNVLDVAYSSDEPETPNNSIESGTKKSKESILTADKEVDESPPNVLAAAYSSG